MIVTCATSQSVRAVGQVEGRAISASFSYNRPTERTTAMEVRQFLDRTTLLNSPELRRKRSRWTGRLPLLPERPSPVALHLVRWHWSFWLPTSIRQTYMLWLARRRYRLNLEQIAEDELEDICALEVDSSENVRAVYEKHAMRRVMARFHVAAKERPRLERLARRWDVDAPPMIVRGEAQEGAITQVRRAIREARWAFIERCAKLLIPVLSLLVALAALLRSAHR
jgi:hypothetical protein